MSRGNRTEAIVIERLAKGYRVDVISSEPGSDKPVRIGQPSHYADYHVARQCAEMLKTATGIAIVDKTDGAGA